MHPISFPSLTLEVALPSRWSLAEPRQVMLRLLNDSGIDLKGLQLRIGWSGQDVMDECWKLLWALPRGGQREESLAVLPPRGREDQFHLSLRLALGPFLELELWSAKVDVMARPHPTMDGAMKVVFKNSGIQGDKIGYGQHADGGGANIGHQVHLHGSNTMAEFERWLEQDEFRMQMRTLPLYIADEKCLPWTTTHGLELAGIPRGDFRMGAVSDDAEAEPEERLCREVTLTRSFWMSRHPVTNAQYANVMKANRPVTLEGHKADRMPVANVTWGQAVDFCSLLTELERKAGALPPGYAYRLPTEAEWEHACRAGSETARHDELAKVGSVQANGGRMMEVGRFESNAWGLYDMLGLVFEWCMDAYNPYKLTEVIDPVCWSSTEGGELRRVIRGGCYQGPDSFARASARWGCEPGRKSHRIGFRVVLAPE